MSDASWQDVVGQVVEEAREIVRQLDAAEAERDR